VILVGTSLPGSDVPDTGIAHADKLVHFALYAVFGLLFARARARVHGARWASPRGLAGAVGLVALLGGADEVHQRWIPGRSADVVDWCADVAGGTFALLLAARMSPRPEQPS
jgi:VanZ family protein